MRGAPRAAGDLRKRGAWERIRRQSAQPGKGSPVAASARRASVFAFGGGIRCLGAQGFAPSRALLFLRLAQRAHACLGHVQGAEAIKLGLHSRCVRQGVAEQIEHIALPFLLLLLPSSDPLKFC